MVSSRDTGTSCSDLALGELVYLSLADSSLGAPLGGIISDRWNWRWAFIFQIPLLIGAGLMIFLKVRYTVEGSTSGASTPVREQTMREKLGRIDWLGSFLLAGTMGSTLLAVSLVTSSTGSAAEFKPHHGHISYDAYKWTDPFIIALFTAGAILLVSFLYVEINIAAEPVLPVELLTQRTPIFVAINNFTISFLIFSIMYSVPLFFTAVMLMSASNAGRHLIPNSVLGSIGSLAVGFIVRATGKYYWLTFICGLFSIFSAVLLSRWDLDTPDWLLWTSFGPMAFSMGSVTTLTIVGLIADIGREHVAVATSRTYSHVLTDTSLVHVPYDRTGPWCGPRRRPDSGCSAKRAREAHHRSRCGQYH